MTITTGKIGAMVERFVRRHTVLESMRNPVDRGVTIATLLVGNKVPRVLACCNRSVMA